MFRRSLIGYNPRSVKMLLGQMEQLYEELLKESEVLIAKVESQNRKLTGEIERLRSLVKDAAERREQIERYREIVEYLLLACSDWCEKEVARVRESEREKELFLAKCDQDLATGETAVENLRKALAERLRCLIEEAKKRLDSGRSQLQSAISLIETVAKERKNGREAEGETDSNAGGEAAAPLADQNRRVVIIDDDPAICSIVRLVMEREGYEVEELGDGRAALDYIEKNHPCTMVVVDLMLPFVDGLQIVRKIRQTPGWQGVPVLVLTSNTSEREIIDLFNAGASEYMTKPFSTLELAARVRRLLEKR